MRQPVSVSASSVSASAAVGAQFGRQLVTEARQTQRRRTTQVALVWLTLFIVLGGMLYLLQIDIPYILAHQGFVVQGLLTTLWVSLLSIACATVLAFVGALGRISTNPIAEGVSGFYISLIRGTPLLVQIYIIYLGLPQIGQQIKVLGYPQLGNLFILSAFASGVLALSLNYGAYMTEIFRAGIQAIPYGQVEAARALGMSYWQSMRLIILPQALRIVIPAIGNQFIAMQKDSALVSLMGVWEVTYRANRFARKDSKFMEMLLLAAAIYWVLTIISEWLQTRLERRMSQASHR
jgi:polar amino acid transport system permease protein